MITEKNIKSYLEIAGVSVVFIYIPPFFIYTIVIIFSITMPELFNDFICF